MSQEQPALTPGAVVVFRGDIRYVVSLIHYDGSVKLVPAEPKP